MTRKALIVGCGYVGSQLKKILVEEGWKVHGLKRYSESDQDILTIDVSREFSLSNKYDVVFYLVSADSYTPESYEIAYKRGVHHTLLALKKSGQSPQFIFVSSTSLFAEKQGSLVDETSAVELTSFSNKYLNSGEELVRNSGLLSTVVRFSGIYGPGRCRVVDQIKSGKARFKIAPYISNRIHLDDCVGILHHIVTIKNPHPLYIGSDSEPTPYNEVISWVAKELGVEGVKMESESIVSPHISNKRCSNQLLISSGYVFRFSDFRRGFRSCL